MNVRNPKYNAVGTIDCEVEHPVYGWIPFTASPDDSNEDGRTLHADLIAGKHGAIAAYVAPLPTESDYVTAVQAHMDGKAQALNYDDIKTAVTYADEPSVIKFQDEGKAFRQWRSLCWDYCYAQLAAVQSGQRTQPTVAELIAELPVIQLPA